MPRYKLTLEYDGSPYAGWQRQAGSASIQATLEAALCSFCKILTPLTAAGRTDAGVHANAQVAHVDLSADWQTKIVQAALNACLLRAGEPISVLKVQKVDDNFNARFSAHRRHYLYRILNRQAPPALDTKRVWWRPQRLDAEKMHKAAQCLVGLHDFTTFRAAACQAKSPLRTLDRLDVRSDGDMILIYASARSFLHHQVRSLAGSLIEVGRGRWQREDLAAALEARERARCGQVAPAHGLYLTGVDYPEPYNS